MKKAVAILVVLALAVYFFWGRSTDVTSDQCSRLGGEMKDGECVTEISEEDCKSQGGTLRDGSCRVGFTADECSQLGGTLTANGECDF